MNIHLGKPESRKIEDLRRCFQAGRDAERLRSRLENAWEAVKHGQARHTGNILSAMIWQDVTPLTSSEHPAGVRKAALAIRRDVRKIHEMVREKSNALKTFERTEKGRLQDALARVQEQVGNLALVTAADCGGMAPGEIQFYLPKLPKKTEFRPGKSMKVKAR